MHKIWDYKNAFRILKGGKISLIVSAFLTTASIVNAAPIGGNVTIGNAKISQNGNVTNINQSSNKASINWQEFSIGKNETVNFNQPNSNSITLNKVIGTSNSLIQGAMNANGQVILVNPNGVVFSESSSVNVGGLIATTKNITDENFQNGNYKFEGDSSASILNKGTINAKYVAMMGKTVQNEGTMVATLGKVELAGGNKFTLNLNGDSLLKLTIDEGTLNALVENKGLIKADGGVVHLTTQALDSILDGVVNNTGVIEAQTLNTNEKGEIVLFAHGGTAEMGGTIDASAPNSGDGGFIETSGNVVNIKLNAKITTKSKTSKTGTWLIDPNDFTIASSGGNITGAQLSSDLGSNNIEIATATQGTSGGNGDIHVNDNVSWSNGNTLTLTAERNININATLDASNGSGGKVLLNYGQGAGANGNTSNYNFGLTSNGFAGKINLQAGQNFSTKLGNNGTQIDYTVITSLGNQADAISAPSLMTLQGIRTNLTGKYVLGSDIDAAATSTWGDTTINGIVYNGFVPLSDGYTTASNGQFSTGNQFKGSFIGLGHSINNLSVDNTNAANTGDLGNNAGLFGATGNAATYIGQFALTNSIIKGNAITGGAVGYAYSGTTLDNIYIKNDVNLNSTSSTGGVVGVITGVNGATTVKNSYAYANIISNGDRVGALVGDSWAGTILNSVTGGSVSGVNSVGGAVGWINGGTTLSHLISSSTVTGTGDGIGGVVGAASAGNSVTYSSATGNISGRYSVGGFIGSMSNTTVDYSYSTGSVSGQSAIGGFAGSVIGSGTSQVSYSYSTGSVTGAITQIGGFVGYISGRIDQSYATGSVSASGASDVGGFVGYIFTNPWEGPGAIYNSYTLSSVLGGSNVGSFAGRNNAGTLNSTIGTIINSYSTGTVSGTTNVGAFIGVNPTDGYITNSFYNTDTTTGLLAVGSGDTTNTTTLLGKTASQMKISDTFSSWGSEIVEDNNLSSTYPVLRWTNDSLTAGSSIWVISPSDIGLNYNLSDQTFVYDGSNHLLSSLWSASSIFGSNYSSWVLGTDYDFVYNSNISSNTNFKNVGTYGLSIVINKDGYRVGTNYTNGTLSITPKALTISGLSSANKIYDGTTTAIVNGTAALQSTETAGSGTTSDGKAYTGDTVSLTGTVNGTFNDKDVADATIVTFSGLSLTGADAGNYTLTPHSTVSNTITAKALTISGLSSANKIYDGTTTAIVNGTAALQFTETAGSGTTSDGKAYTGDTVSLTGTVNGTFNDKDVADATTVTFSGLSLTGADAGNYTLTPHSTASQRISAKALTIITTVDDKTYDGTTNATIHARTLNGLIGEETLRVTATGTFNSANAGSRTVVANYSLTDGTGLASNYLLENTTENAVIHKANVNSALTNTTITVGTAISLSIPTFIGGIPTGTATVKIYDLNNVDVTAQALAGTLAVGTYTVKTVSLVDNNYNLVNSGNTDGILTINSNINVNDFITNIVNNAVKPNIPVLSLNPIRIDVVNGFERKVNSSIVNNTPNLNNSKSVGSSNLGLNEVIRSVKPDVNNVVKDTKLTVVGETGGEGQIAVVELAELIAKSGGGELRVALSPDSFVELVNGGVSLPDGVSQEFYVVEDKK